MKNAQMGMGKIEAKRIYAEVVVQRTLDVLKYIWFIVLKYIVFAYSANSVCLNGTSRNPNQVFVINICYLVWSFKIIIKKNPDQFCFYLFICNGLCSPSSLLGS